MRVLHVIDSLNRGGAEVMLTAMAPRFRARGIVCDVIALLQKPSPLERSLLGQDIHLRFTGVRKLYSPYQISALAKLLQGYDIVHVHLFPAQLWAVLAAARLRCRVPLVTTEHNTWNARRRWWLRPLDRWMYPHYERIACISQATAEHLIQWCPGIAEKIAVIPNGIPLETFETAQPATLPDVPCDGTRLVFVGRFEPQKDHATLLRAVTAVPDTHLLLVGDGPLRPHIEHMAQSLGIRDRITFLGWRGDVAAVLKASDIYVHSTNSDGFGIAACEAMAAGLPVIASNVPGLAELVTGAGILFPPGDDKALAGQLTALIKSPEQRRAMNLAGRQRARQFSIESTVDNCVGMYESVLLGSRTQTAKMAMNNSDPDVVKAFGEEWNKFHYPDRENLDLQTLFQSYFSIFPWQQLPPDAEGFDLGCGTGRWAHFVAQKVGFLHCIDASSTALDMARRNLEMHPNCGFHCASIDAIPLRDGSADFGYSLGVLHHVPDTEQGIRECARKLKPGAPLLIYLYYAFDNRPAWFRAIWRLSDLARRFICVLPFAVRSPLCDLIAAFVYWPLARLAGRLEILGMDVSLLPLSSYRSRSFYSMRTDALDRFGTRLEKRFTRKEINQMLESAGFERIAFSESPCWCAIGYRRPIEHIEMSADQE